MTEPLFQLLDAVNIDEDRQYIEFRFRDYEGEQKIIQIDFDYLKSLTGVLRQAFISAALTGQQGSNQTLGEDWIAVPRVDIDQPVNVGIDVMSGKIVTMLLLGSPIPDLLFVAGGERAGAGARIACRVRGDAAA